MIDERYDDLMYAARGAIGLLVLLAACGRAGALASVDDDVPGGAGSPVANAGVTRDAASAAESAAPTPSGDATASVGDGEESSPDDAGEGGSLGDASPSTMDAADSAVDAAVDDAPDDVIVPPDAAEAKDAAPDTGGGPCVDTCESRGWECGSFASRCNARETVTCYGCAAGDLCGDNGTDHRCGHVCRSEPFWETSCRLPNGTSARWDVAPECVDTPWLLVDGGVEERGNLAGCAVDDAGVYAQDDGGIGPGLCCP